MSDLFGNHIVGFPTRRLKCGTSLLVKGFIDIDVVIATCIIMSRLCIIRAASWENQQCGFRTGPTQTNLYKRRSRLEA